MSDKNIKLNNTTTETTDNDNLALDDARRVKVLSPNQLVFKRFVRNRLAIIGSVIIILMFLFAYVGAWISPYEQDQIFTGYVSMQQDYASAIQNEDFRFAAKPGASFTSLTEARFIGALANKEKTFTSDKTEYFLEKHSDKLYGINRMGTVATVNSLSNEFAFKDDKKVDEALKNAILTAKKDGKNEFEHEGVHYVFKKEKFSLSVLSDENVAIATTKAFSANKEGATPSFDFLKNANIAVDKKEAKFSADGKEYLIDVSQHGSNITDATTKELVGNLSDYVVQSTQGVQFFIPLELKTALIDAITTEKKSIDFTIDGEKKTYVLERENKIWTIRADREVLSSTMYASPSWEHPLGTDNQGMDILVRLMYGGRVSLLIGFAVVFLAAIFGIILGGVSGYFGGIIDQVIMRIVDIFYCIPSMPIIIIIGASLDVLRVSGNQRMLFLMLILGLLGWPSIARMIRGQILSLREQEFMLATEATGIRVSKRIFRHLVPNVMPLLIVMATMSIGGTILTESTLSFLGLGVKFPYASWGNIINAVSNDYVMRTYWFVWVPAGICILLTVLAFNFIGDGLRDAYDPKQKQ